MRLRNSGLNWRCRISLTCLHHFLPVLFTQFHDKLASQVGGHDQNGILEIHRTSLAVSHAAIIKNLQQNIEYIRMRLFNLIKQDDGIGPPPDSFGKIASFFIAHISWRGADQPGDGMFLHEFRHIQPDHGLFAVKKELCQGAGQFRLADTGGSQEDKGPERSVRILQAGPGPPHRIGNSSDGLGLANNPPGA